MKFKGNEAMLVTLMAVIVGVSVFMSFTPAFMKSSPQAFKCRHSRCMSCKGPSQSQTHFRISIRCTARPPANGVKR